MPKIFNCTPKPAMLRSVQNENWTVVGALAELIDNSFGSGRGDAREVTITYDAGRRLLEVLDNGRGMDAIGRLFQHGNTIGRSIGDIGVYGAGGTKALLWLAQEVWIWTLRDGMMQHDKVYWPDWFELKSFAAANVSDEWHKATVANVPLSLYGCHHGTLIRLHLLRSRTLRQPTVIRELSRLYSTGLRNGRSITWKTQRGRHEESLALTDPFTKMISEKTKVTRFDLIVEHDEAHLPVHGRVTYDENTPAAESKIYIGFGHRIITSTTDCFQSHDGAEKYVGLGVTGWLDLGDGWQPFLSTTKDRIDDTPLYEKLMQYVFENIRHVLKDSERRAFSLQFDGIAIGVEQALNNKGGDLAIKVGTIVEPLEPLGGTGFGADEPKLIKEKPIVPEVDDPGGKGDQHIKEAPPIFQVAIMQENDAMLESALCRANINNTPKACDILVLVNRDHELVQEALRSRPPKRDLLNLLIVDEIARAVDEDLIAKLFHPKLAGDICDIQDVAQRMRVVSRRLVDRVIVKDEAA